MSHEQLVDIYRDVLDHACAGTVELAPDVARVPVLRYVDPERWTAEVNRIFRRVPVVLAVAADVAEPGSYRALTIAGVPVLVSRGHDGELRAFVNMCSHRAAVVVPEGNGTARRFTCPYHAWSYDQTGALVGVLDRADFGEIDTSCLGLAELAVAERAGLVFGCLDPGRELHLDEFLAGYDDLLAHLGIADHVVVGRQAIPGPNWKVAYDGYLDFYHLATLHKDTFGPDYSNKAIYRSWGPHQRVLSPDHRVAAMAEVAEQDWPVRKLCGGVWTIFPHVSVASFDVEGERMLMLSQLAPGDTVDESLTTQHFLMDGEPDGAMREAIAKVMAFLDHVVRDEDYATGLGITRAMRTGAKDHVLFGRNEGGGQRFHRWVDALVATDDDDLVELYATGVG